ncbi:protein of unknown function [Shewanella benthica]|uniref:Uncharacterized protein n=1 Tax=Shewanella benthica TaxID=43661 RepID=A0A330LXS2_9GAMM|nr:protein of unknown function [Shewanella benthica]
MLLDWRGLGTSITGVVALGILHPCTQVRDGVYQHIDDKGNFENKTDESPPTSSVNWRSCSVRPAR